MTATLLTTGPSTSLVHTQRCSIENAIVPKVKHSISKKQARRSLKRLLRRRGRVETTTGYCRSSSWREREPVQRAELIRINKFYLCILEYKIPVRKGACGGGDGLGAGGRALNKNNKDLSLFFLDMSRHKRR